MGTGQSKISACTYRMFEREGENSPAVNTDMNSFTSAGIEPKTWLFSLYLSRLFLWTDVHLKTHAIVIKGCFSHPSFICFLCVSCCFAVRPAENTAGAAATASTCHFSCTVPVYPAGSVPALQAWPFLN